MYNDFELISENKIMELKKAYNDKLNKIKSLNLEDDFIVKYKKLNNYLTNALHYINNLLNLSKNIENKNLLKKLEEEIIVIIEKLKNLYEINDIELENSNEKQENYNFSSNIKSSIDNLVCFLEEMFSLILYETNIKVKLVLENIFLDILNYIKKLNSLYNTSSMKIFSFFKRY